MAAANKFSTETKNIDKLSSFMNGYCQAIKSMYRIKNEAKIKESMDQIVEIFNDAIEIIEDMNDN